MAVIIASCNKDNGGGTPEPSPVDPVVPERTGDSRISYQLLVYSFADSDGDGIGDFKGIQDKLGYLKEMGVQALWLSPIHPATSYHGYDVEDYSTVNPEYGTEADFKALLDAAHSSGIKIYIDYVLNHSSKNHPWFLEGKSDSGSKYWNYYNFSASAKSGWSQTVSGEDPGKIKVRFTLTCDSSGKPETIKAERTDDISNSGTSGSGKYLWYGSVTESTMPEFYDIGNNTYTLGLELETSWGVLVRTSKTSWGNDKYGATSASANTLAWGAPLNLKSNSDYDILMPWMKPVWYQSVFGSYMPDLNYGPASTCETSDTFKEVCAAADKWIGLGVDGFRLDAVKHIYDSETSDENPTFLKKFYDHCNTTYKAAGHSEDIYMVGEQWNEPNLVTPYYKGLNAFFEFAFWWRLTEAISSGKASDFASTINGYHEKYTAVRSDAIAATKLTNHDEDRAGTTLGRSTDKLKLAGAVLLTSAGEPYIYQGEELGYWGSKSGGDEYVRTPVLWGTAGESLADKKLGDKIDRSMLSDGISVSSQSADENSVLSLYRKFGVLRDRYPALAKGTMTACRLTGATDGIASWYREYGDQKILVIHNFSSQATVTLANNGNLICSNGKAELSGTRLTIGQYSSAIILIK